ncbi:MAG: TonB-dependent receptor, partial [Gemmatimonadaceae bacterium]|nr:TonB-dependent receptor [Gemmatimonadaceae bacterium]
VIQLFTRNGEGPTRWRAALGGGTYGTAKAELSAQGGTARFGWSGAVGEQRSAGIYEFNNGFENRVMSGGLRVAPRDGTTLRLNARYGSNRYQYPTDFAGAVIDRNAQQVTHRAQLGLEATQRVSERVSLHIVGTRGENLPKSNDDRDSPGDTLGFYGYHAQGRVMRSAVDVRTDIAAGARHTVSVGAAYADDRERSSNISLSQYGDFPGAFRAARTTRSLYAQALGDATPRLSYSFGGRIDDNSAFDVFRTVRAGAGWRLAERTRLRASAGNAFKAPTFGENYASGFVVGNPDLRPEQTRTVEVGVDQRFVRGATTIRFTGFRQQFRDLIQYRGGLGTTAAPNYFNLAAANANGLESEFAVRIRGTSLAFNHSWTATRVVDAGADTAKSANFVRGQPLLRRPSQAVAGVLSRAVAGGQGSVTAQWVGARADRDFASFPAKAVTLAPYARIDLAYEHPLRWHVGAEPTSLLVRLDNAFDRRYEAIYGFRAPGRAWFVGARIGAR